MFFKFVDRNAPKADIRDMLLWLAADEGEELSKARAHNLATKFKKGEFDPDLARFIQYSDPVGEEATRNADRAPKSDWPTYEAPPMWYIRPLGDTFGSAA